MTSRRTGEQGPYLAAKGWTAEACFFPLLQKRAGLGDKIFKTVTAFPWSALSAIVKLERAPAFFLRSKENKEVLPCLTVVTRH